LTQASIPELVEVVLGSSASKARTGLGPKDLAVMLPREICPTELTRPQAQRLLAALELGRRLYGPEGGDAPNAREEVHCAKQAVAALRPVLCGLEVEEFHVLLLDAKNKIKGHECIARGSLARVNVHPRDVFVAAVRERAAGVIVAHNHPSGDPEPSLEDAALTVELAKAGSLLDIHLIDHVIVGAGGRYVSLADLGVIERKALKR
jgi:DNA repair protein RadC